MSAKEKTTGFLAEFRKFIARGNVMDLAVGVIIGAFKGITDSLVNDILNPVLGIFAGDNEALAGLAIPLPGGGDLMLGSFLNAVLSFLIMAFVVFCIVKLLNRLHKGGGPPPRPQAIGGGGALTETRIFVKITKMAELPDNKNQEELSSTPPRLPGQADHRLGGGGLHADLRRPQPLPVFSRRNLSPGAGPPAGLPRRRRTGGDCRLAVPPAGVHLPKKACMALLAAACVVILAVGLVQGVPALLAGLGV